MICASVIGSRIEIEVFNDGSIESSIFTGDESIISGSDFVKKIIEKPKREEILSPYAASVMFIFPDAIWDYLPKVEPSPRGEIELQSAVQQMIEDGYQAFGLLQPAPQEWTPELHSAA